MTLQAPERTQQGDRSDRRQIVGWWLGTRILTLVAALAGGWTAVSNSATPVATYIERWNRWDTSWFESIAVDGYIGRYISDFENFEYNVAFFPGVPMLMRVGLALGISATATGIAISLVASLIAATGLVRIAEQTTGEVGKYAAIAWLVAPTAVFLTAAYTEALFCAFAFWAWVWAQRRSWLTAGLLAGGAGLIRPNGSFLAAGLVLLFILTDRPRSPRQWLRGLPLLLPVFSAGLYFGYLRIITGSWTAWSDAQSEFWGRSLVDPITALVNTYELIWTFSPTGEPSSRMVTEIIAMAVLIAVTVIVAIKRWWPEALYSGVTALSLGTSTMYYSIPRTLIVIFPLWVLIGLVMAKRPWLRWTFIGLSLPALVLVTIRFTQNQWIS